jgi:hypothetical protein
MTGRIEETLGSEISVELSADGELLFSDRGIHAGLEVVNPDQLQRGTITHRRFNRPAAR